MLDQATACAFRRSVVWLRRDLRLRDNVALAHAAQKSDSVALAFVIDEALLRGGRMSAAIVQCFFSAAAALRSELRALGSDLVVLQGDPAPALIRFARSIDADAVFFNEDYEPDALVRDARVTAELESASISAHPFIDHVYFGASDIQTAEGCAYKVFSAYKARWLQLAGDKPLPAVPSLDLLREKLASRPVVGESADIPAPEAYGFASSSRYPACSEREAHTLLRRFVSDDLAQYPKRRDFPACDGTSHLSPHLRAGTIGIRTCVDAAKTSPKWLEALIWRDFYQTILKRFPKVATGPFLEAAARLRWNEPGPQFDAWCEARTGFPIVDGAMRQLNETGWMHNRLRMIVASFLTKDLLIDWRQGERYFERRLADADLAQNNGGWQWSASTGTDPVPYFRIFNPVRQGEKFDPEGAFVKAMLPELRDVPAKFVHAPWLMEMPPKNYPPPLVDHDFARKRALAEYTRAFKSVPRR